MGICLYFPITPALPWHNLHFLKPSDHGRSDAKCLRPVVVLGERHLLHLCGGISRSTTWVRTHLAARERHPRSIEPCAEIRGDRLFLGSEVFSIFCARRCAVFVGQCPHSVVSSGATMLRPPPVSLGSINERCPQSRQVFVFVQADALFPSRPRPPNNRRRLWNVRAPSAHLRIAGSAPRCATFFHITAIGRCARTTAALGSPTYELPPTHRSRRRCLSRDKPRACCGRVRTAWAIASRSRMRWRIGENRAPSSRNSGQRQGGFLCVRSVPSFPSVIRRRYPLWRLIGSDGRLPTLLWTT